MKTERNLLYEQLPQVGEFLEGPRSRELLREFPRSLVLDAVRSVLSKFRDEIAAGTLDDTRLLQEIEALPERVASVLHDSNHQSIRPVINATGVILQTNLGRAPLSEAALLQIADVARGYCNLEFDLANGERGRRGVHAEYLLLRLAGRETPSSSALVVNNCAAAAFLALDSIAAGGEVIVSRGELVEIGGGFRVPEILRKSGARLVEVGTTNRTRLQDYAAAITAETRLILNVHQSNFRIIGFTQQPDLRELVGLGAQAGVPVMVDQGTGSMVSLADYGLAQGSSFHDAVKSAASLICASGDKLLGGPQCGLVVGDDALVRRLRSNPLYRALRVDKLTLGALEATLHAYLSHQADTIPLVSMLAIRPEAIRKRCERWAESLGSQTVTATVAPTESTIGGGTAPGATLPSFAVALAVQGMSADQLSAALRKLDPPVIARIHEARVLLDLRTVPESIEAKVLPMLSEAFTARASQTTHSSLMDPSL